MKILITGGSGFLGSHVADYLSKAGHEVTILDICPSPYLRKDQKMIVGDILDESLINEVVVNHEIVYHFAGIADIDECAEKPVDTVKLNILATVFLLEACRKNQIKRFVFASSAYVFSDAGYFYRISKQTCESFIENYHERYNLPYTCLRYGSLYGDRADERNSIYRLLKDAILNKKISYKGQGDEVREFIHVRDAAQISVEILDTKFENQNVILTGTEKLTYRQLLETIQEILKNKIHIDILPSSRKAHYKLTPYNFIPKLGKKIVCNPYIDMGQGLLLCMAEIYEKFNHEDFDEINLLL